MSSDQIVHLEAKASSEVQPPHARVMSQHHAVRIAAADADLVARCLAQRLRPGRVR